MYNNFYGYQNAYPYGQMFQQPQQPQQIQQPGGDDRIWVANEAAANAYMVTANGFVRLWDSGAPLFYEKQADATGRPLPMVVYEYKPRAAAPAQPNMDAYITRDEFEKRLKEVTEHE